MGNPNGNKPLYLTDEERRKATVRNTLNSRARHREKFNAYKAKWTKANPEKVREYNQKQYYKNHEKTLEYHKEYRDLLKEEIVAAYGSKCTCCGERESDFLTVDHVYGRNNRPDIYTHPKKGGTPFYLWLKKNHFPQEGFALLCFNCNLGRDKAVDKICPHMRFDEMRLVSAC
jgi:hypothetical protein